MLQAIFSMSFFHFTEGIGVARGRWTVSEEFWLFWAVAVPLTALTAVVWVVWQKKSTQRVVDASAISKHNPPFAPAIPLHRV